MLSKRPIVISALLFTVALGLVSLLIARQAEDHSQSVSNRKESASSAANVNNPLAGKKFYVDTSRSIVKLAEQYRLQGRTEDATLANKIASQPGAVWLTGPTDSDLLATRDISEVKRTSAEAATQGTVPVYQLYAVPNRDSCAAHSKGGFENGQQYLAWLDSVLASLNTDAVFSVEADAVAHTLTGGCLNGQQTTERLSLLNAAMSKLADHPKVLAAYLDAGHSEWFPDPTKLVQPLREAGVDKGRGIASNISFFVETAAITEWSQILIQKLSGDKGVLIDTSRNGKGVPPNSVQGEARWCNPSGRGLGPSPTTSVQSSIVDAYIWIKTPGESDGACFGYPAAGVFVPSIAIELSRNAQ